MKSSKFFIKSNYIKNTKSDWVFCNGTLFNHENITILHLKSENIDKLHSDNILGNGNHHNGFNTLSQLYQSQLNHPRLSVIFNLCQFKSCEIKSVLFKGIHKFAIKLVPPGFLRSKKLYLLPDIEDSLTEWCGIFSGFIIRPSNTSNPTSPIDNKNIVMTQQNIPFRKISESKQIPNNMQAVYISLDENDAYESSPQSEFYLVTIEPTPDSMKLNIKGDYIMKLDPDSLELLEITTRETIHVFPYSSIRRFGAKDNFFRLEAGRHCTTGHGSFLFLLKDAVRVADQLKINTKLLKSAQEQMQNSCMTLTKSCVSDMSLQAKSPMYATLNRNSNNGINILSPNATPLPERPSILRNSSSKESTLSRLTTSFDFENENKSYRNTLDSSINKYAALKISETVLPKNKLYENMETKVESVLSEGINNGKLKPENSMNYNFYKGIDEEDPLLMIRSFYIHEKCPEIIPRRSYQSIESGMDELPLLPAKSTKVREMCVQKNPLVSDINNNSFLDIKSIEIKDVQSNDVIVTKEEYNITFNNSCDKSVEIKDTQSNEITILNEDHNIDNSDDTNIKSVEVEYQHKSNIKITKSDPNTNINSPAIERNALGDIQGINIVVPEKSKNIDNSNSSDIQSVKSNDFPKSSIITTREDMVTPTPISKNENKSNSFNHHSISNSISSDQSSLPSELSNCPSNESFSYLKNVELDQRPISLFEASTDHTLSNSTSTSDSPTFGSLPFPKRPSTVDYKITDSTFFKYRKFPKPPVRTTPPLNNDTPRTSFTFSQQGLSDLEECEYHKPLKKPPPPLLPKPKLQISEENVNQSSFREFDQILKNLDLSFAS